MENGGHECLALNVLIYFLEGCSWHVWTPWGARQSGTCTQSRAVQMGETTTVVNTPGISMGHAKQIIWGTAGNAKFSRRQCSGKKFWSSDNISDGFVQIIRHFEKKNQTFQFKYSQKVFQMIRQYYVWWFWTNHQSFCKIISNAWWADAFSWTLRRIKDIDDFLYVLPVIIFNMYNLCI